ncbi:MAG: hypothetical protein ACKVQK_18405 [Burkholderiales bacterium]
MSAVIIEHVNIADLPETWRAKLPASKSAHVTVRIESEPSAASTITSVAAASATPDFVTDDPAFGIWRDRDDMADVEAYVRKMRMPRYNRDGSRNEN